MPLLKNNYTSEDYWNLPEGERAELIGGKFYDMAPPSRIHQRLVSKLTALFNQYITDHHGSCEVYPAPFAVNLDADDKDWVEPDISVICDSNKLTDRGCSGAPDLIIEIVSPSSRRMDYNRKNTLYSDAGVREYWIVDKTKNRIIVYNFEKNDMNEYTFSDLVPAGIYDNDSDPYLYSFDVDIPVGIYPGLTIRIRDLLK